MATTTIHPFEQAGLGLAPFRFEGMSEKVYVACPGAPEQPAGSCAYCYTGIKYCCHIASADGKRFVVGCDCVRKLERDDNRLVSAMEREVAKAEKAKRDAKRAAKWEVVRVARESELQAQRERNGGMTDAEAAARARDEKDAAVSAAMALKNGWLIAVLANLPYNSDFAESMIQKLARVPASEMSERCLSILSDIYAKSFGRRGSKAYAVAVEEFNAKVGE